MAEIGKDMVQLERETMLNVRKKTLIGYRGPSM